MGVSHPPVSRRSVGNTSKQPYFHLSACRRSSRAGIQSAIQGEWVFTRRIEDCAKPKAPGVSQAALEVMFDECRDFIQAHYVISPREDTPFWRANSHELRVSPNFMEKRETYEAGLALSTPTASADAYYSNFELELKNFWTNHNYYCIFAGLGHYPRRVLPVLRHKSESRATAASLFKEIANTQKKGSPQTGVGGLRRDRRVGEGCWQFT